MPLSPFNAGWIALLALASVQAAPLESQPPRETRLVEMKGDAFSGAPISEDAAKALAIEPAKWKHAETPNFIVHYRRVTEAQRAVREIEYNLWYVAKTLGATPDRYTRKSHVFIFQDQREWKTFLSQTHQPEWSASFAHGDTLFLHIGGMGESFDSNMLAHETTHAVVARLYPNRRWPLWLNEGFAEAMGNASVAARKGQYLKGMERRLHYATLPLDRLTAMEAYPEEREAVHQLYETSEKVVRFLLSELPQDRFPKFAEAVLDGATLDAAVVQVYGDRFSNGADFEKQYARFE